MSDASPFSKLVPGFDFLQGLVKNAGAALPGIGQWVAPTIDPAELQKRIEELRTVQFWLEQNGRMLGATIQALEVQRMTLSTLKTMNVQMEDLRDSMQIRLPVMAPPPPRPVAEPAPAPAPEPEAAAATQGGAEAAAPAPTAAPGAVDPLQWWGALTKQFTELATQALKDTGADAARKMASASLKSSLDAGTPAPARKAAPKKRAPARKTASASATARKTAAAK